MECVLVGREIFCMFGIKRNGITLVIKEFKDGCGGCHLQGQCQPLLMESYTQKFSN